MRVSHVSVINLRKKHPIKTRFLIKNKNTKKIMKTEIFKLYRICVNFKKTYCCRLWSIDTKRYAPCTPLLTQQIGLSSTSSIPPIERTAR